MLDCGFSPLMPSLSDKNMRLGDVLLPPDTSQTYLLFQTLLLLFWLHSCTIWTKLTRTDAVFSRAAVLFLFFRFSGDLKCQKNSRKIILKVSMMKASGITEAGPRGHCQSPRRVAG